jgi:DNA-binding MarR family transcriptional regulator
MAGGSTQDTARGGTQGVTEGTAEGSTPGAARSAADDPDVAAWRALLVAHSRLVPAVEAELRAAGQVSLSWYDVLLELNSAPERRLRMSELGQRVVLSRTRVSRVVDELTAAGLAERQPDRADGRSSFAALTPQGRAALRRAWPVYREAIRRRLGTQLTPEQCLDLARLLEQAARGT